MFTLFLMMVSAAFIGCYGADSPDNVDRPAQQAQAGDSTCIGGCNTVGSTQVTNGAPAWFITEGIELIVPGVRCIDPVAYPGFVPAATSCTDVWAGFQTGFPPQYNVSTPGRWAARIHVRPGAIALDGPPIYLWVSEALYSGGTLTRFRWKYVTVRWRALGVLFSVTSLDDANWTFPGVRPDGSCRALFTYFPTTQAGPYTTLEAEGYRMDLIAVAAFRPASSLAVERRVGRYQALPSWTIPSGVNPQPFSPQAVYQLPDGCWFGVNYSDAQSGVFTINLATADEYLRNSFAIFGP